MGFLKFLGRALIVLIGLLIVLVLAGFLLPREVEVSRSAIVAAPPEKVFPYVNSLRKFTEWSPWQELDPDMAQEFSGPDEGIGAKMVWTSEDPGVGEGSQEIIASDPDKLVIAALDFGDMGQATTSMSLVPVDGGTEVTWGLEADMGSGPISRWVGLFMDRLVGADYEKGLANLQNVAAAE